MNLPIYRDLYHLNVSLLNIIENIPKISRVVLNAPEKHCRRCGDLSLWRHIKPHKSLFTNGEGKGLPIGDLVVQMAANILLNDTDHFITDILDIKMARYVDDMVLIHQDKDYLLRAVPKIRALLLQTAGVELHPHKFYIQHYTKGVKFVGAVIKPHRTYVANRTVNNAFASIRRLHKSKARAEDIVASVNSYLGIMRHHRTYRIRQRLCRLISKRFGKKVIVEHNHKKINDRRTKTTHSLTRGTGARAHRLQGVAEDAKSCRES